MKAIIAAILVAGALIAGALVYQGATANTRYREQQLMQACVDSILQLGLDPAFARQSCREDQAKGNLEQFAPTGR